MYQQRRWVIQWMSVSMETVPGRYRQKVYRSWESELRSPCSSDSALHFSSFNTRIGFKPHISAKYIFAWPYSSLKEMNAVDGLPSRSVKLWLPTKTFWNRDNLLRGAGTMAVSVSKFVSLPILKYSEALGELICVWDFEMTVSTSQMISFCYPLRSVTGCIEQLSTHQLAHSRIMPLLLMNKHLNAIIIGHEAPTRA